MRDHIGKHKNLWGLDQATLNVVYHSGMLDHLNITINTYTQRMGNNMLGFFNYDKEFIFVAHFLRRVGSGMRSAAARSLPERNRFTAEPICFQRTLCHAALGRAGWIGGGDPG